MTRSSSSRAIGEAGEPSGEEDELQPEYLVQILALTLANGVSLDK